MSDIRKSNKDRKSEKGFTLIELLVVAAIIGILLALAIPNLIKARISANEANARKSMQTLRDAEGEFFEQDLDNDGARDYTAVIGSLTGAAGSLRNPEGTSEEVDALIDSSFEGATGAADGSCGDPKSGYCITFEDDSDITITNPLDDFGWEATMSSFRKTGRKDFGVYGDGVIRCTVPTALNTGDPGTFDVLRTNPACD